jgi:transposase
MWTPTTRQQHSRPVTRYQTDLTDAEWRVIAPHLPKPWATGRPRREGVVRGFFGLLVAVVLAASAATLVIPNPSVANPILCSGVSY